MRTFNKACEFHLHGSVLSSAKLSLQWISESHKSAITGKMIIFWFWHRYLKHHLISYFVCFQNVTRSHADVSPLYFWSAHLLLLTHSSKTVYFNYLMMIFFSIKDTIMFIWITSTLEKLWWNNNTMCNIRFALEGIFVSVCSLNVIYTMYYKHVHKTL